MKTRRNARENIGLMLTTVTILTQFLVTSASDSPSATLSHVVDCKTSVLQHPDQICSQDVNRIATCKDRCGNRYDLPCSCDSQCVIYNNCCENMTFDCPEILEEGKEKYGHLLGAGICTRHEYFMIDSCKQSSGANSFDREEQTTGEQETSDQSLLRLLSNIPVTNIEDGVTYINSDTYLCFNNESVSKVVWDVSFELDALEPPTDLKSLGNIINVDSVMYTPPARLEGLLRPCLYQAVNHCQDSQVAQRHPELETQCRSFISYVGTVKISDNSKYTNRFCLECSEPEETDFASLDRVQNQREGMLHFSILVSLQAQNKITLKASHPSTGLADVMTWQTASCDLTRSLHINKTKLEESTRSSQDGLCQVGACETGYKKHSDGQCKKLHVLEIGVADDEFPLTATDKVKLPLFMECALRKHVDTEVARVLIPARAFFDKSQNKTLYVVNVAMYEPRYNIMDGIFTTYKTWTLQWVSIVKAFHEYRKKRARMPTAVLPTRFGPMGNMVKNSITQQIETYDLLPTYSLDTVLKRGPPINNMTTTFCLRAPRNVMGCWEDHFFASEEKLISDLTQSSCFSQLQDFNHGVGNGATGQTPINQFSWNVWLLVGVGLVTAFIY